MVKREELENKLGKIINGVKGNLAKGVIVGEINEENYDGYVEDFLNDEINKLEEKEIIDFFKELILSTFKKEFEQMKTFYNDKEKNNYEDYNDKIPNIKVYKLEKDENNQLKSKEATDEDLKELSKKLNIGDKKEEIKKESSKRFRCSTKELPKSIDQILSILLNSIKDENLE
jgi:putative exonuclease SBCC